MTKECKTYLLRLINADLAKIESGLSHTEDYLIGVPEDAPHRSYFEKTIKTATNKIEKINKYKLLIETI